MQDAISIDYKLIDQLSDGALDLTAANGMVELIVVLPRGTEQSYQLHYILSTYGKPERVLFEADTDYDQFHIFLYYLGRGISAYYEGMFTRLSKTYQICPQGIGPELWLWSPGKLITQDDQFVGPEPARLMSSITESTNLDIESFYETYKNPNSICFETPRNHWELP